MATNKLPTKAQARVLNYLKWAEIEAGACPDIWFRGRETAGTSLGSCCRQRWADRSIREDGYQYGRITPHGLLALAAYEAKHGEVKDA